MARQNWGPALPSISSTFETDIQTWLKAVQSAGTAVDSEVQAACGDAPNLSTRLNTIISGYGVQWLTIANASRTNSTTFTIASSNVVSDYPVGMPISWVASSTTVYSYVSSASYSSGNTVVVVEGNIASGATGFSRGSLRPEFVPKSSGDVRNDIKDVNNNLILDFSEQSSAVNYLRLANSSTGSAVALSSQGSDTNIDLTISPKGSGQLRIGGSSSVVVDPTNGVLKLSNRIFTGGSTSSEGGSGSLTLYSPDSATPCLVAKNSYVSHGMTSLAETDTFFFVGKDSSTAGGARLTGLTESVAALSLFGYATTGDTTSTNSSGAPLYFNSVKKSGTGSTDLASNENLVTFANAGNSKIWLKGNGDAVFAGKVSTGSSTSSEGGSGSLTLYSPDSATPCLVAKNSYVSHGMTSLAETDTFFFVGKDSSTAGGARLTGLTESVVALSLFGYATTGDTTSTNSSGAPLYFNSAKKSGTGATDMGSTDNIFAVANAGNSKLLLKGNGSLYASNTSITAFDAEDDLALIESLKNWTGGESYRLFVTHEQKQKLEDLSIISGDFLNVQNMLSLTFGGMVQLNEKLIRVVNEFALRLGIGEQELQQIMG